MSRLLQILCTVLAAASLVTAADLGQLQQSFMARYDEANATRDESLKKLETSYLGALKRHMDKVKASGKLELVVPVRDEIEAVESKADPLPVLPENTSYDLRQLRKKYETACRQVVTDHAETILDLAEKMSDVLEKQEAELTKAGNIDEAVAAKRMRETLALDSGVTRARGIIGQAASPLGAKADEKWRNLLLEQYQVEKQGYWHVGPLAPMPGDIRAYGRLVDDLKGLREKPEGILMSPSPARTSFVLKAEVTAVRGSCYLGHPGGEALFRVLAGDTVVFESKLGGKKESKSFKVEFEGVRKLVLEVDPLGSDIHDWCAWLALEVR